MGNQAHRPAPAPRPRWPPSAPPSPSCPALTSSPRHHRRPARPVVHPDHQRQGPQAAAAHPAGRRHHHPVSQRPPPRSRSGCTGRSGASQQVQVTRRRSAVQLRCTDPAAIELARRIGPGLDNNTLAGALNDAGHRTGTGQPFDGVAAGNLRSYHHIPYPGLLEAGELTPRQVAQLDRRVHRHRSTTGSTPATSTARRGPAGRWCIPLPAPRPSRLPGPRRRLCRTSTATPTRHPAANTSSASPMPPAASASSPTSSTHGHNGGTCPPAEVTPDGCGSTVTPAIERT